MNSPLKNIWHGLGLNKAVLALSIARMADAIGNSILFIAIPLYVKKLPEPFIHFPLPIMVGLLISAYGFTAAILQPFLGVWIDRWGHKKLTIQVGLGILGTATLIFIWARNFLDLFLLRLLQGLGLAMEIPPTMAILTVSTQQSTRGGSMGVYTTFRMLGLTVGPLIGGVLHDYFGFEATFIVGAIILYIALLIVQFSVKEIHSADPVEDSRKGSSSFDLSLFSAGLLSAAFATLVMSSAFTLITTLENEFNSRLNIGAFGFAIAFSSLMIGRLIFQVPLGHLSDRFGRKPFVLVGLIALVPINLLLGEVETLWEFAGLRFAQGIASAAIISPALALASDLSRRGSEGRQTSIVTMGFSLGIGIGPLLAGFLSLVFFEFPFLIMGALSLVAAIVVYFYMPRTVEEHSS